MHQHQPNLFDTFVEWRYHLVTTVQTKPWLTGALWRQSRRLWPRFAYFYRWLHALPRRHRRLVRRKLGATLTGAALLLALSGTPAQANTIDVDGLTCTLADAITAANTDTATGGCPAGNGADSLNITADITLTAALPTIVTEITIEGNEHTIQRNDSAPNFRIMTVDGSGDLTLNEATISGGAEISGPLTNGGGVFNSGILTINHSIISDNSVRYGRGGGLFNDGEVKINDSIISSNSSLVSGGVANWGKMDIINSTISNNSAISIGGVENDGILTINNSVISNNGSGDSSSGGGVVNDGSLTINHSTISGNSAGDYGRGGGVYNFGGQAEITNSAISGNSANWGGGVYNFGGQAEITNSVISGNSAYWGGGGVANDGSLTINNSTISGNSAYDYYYDYGEGGGLFNSTDGVLTLNQSLIAGNSATGGSEIFNHVDNDNSGTINTDNYNLFGHNGLTNAQAFTNFTPGSTDITATGDGITPTALDSILNPTLTDNGGETQTHALIFGGPAIDAAPNAACTGGPLNGLDQRGQPRNADGDLLGDSGTECDIGAFEFQPAHLTLVKTVDEPHLAPLQFTFEASPPPLPPTFTLTTNSSTKTITFDLPPNIYTVQERPSSDYGLVNVTCTDSQNNDVTDIVADHTLIQMTVDITLTAGDVVTCTFQNELLNFGPNDNQIYLPILLK